MYSAQDPQLKWPPLFYVFLATLVNVWSSQRHTPCSLRSTFGAEGLTCKNIPWQKFIIWRHEAAGTIVLVVVVVVVEVVQMNR